MTKRDTIEAIRVLNPTATPDFLCEFSPDELSRYLNRLKKSSGGRTAVAMDVEARSVAATL